MTTATLETKRFTLQVGDQLIELPEASSRNEALRKSGLTPAHWPEKPAMPHIVSKGKAKARKQSHSTSRHIKKPIPRTKNSKKISRQPKTVTLPTNRNANCNGNSCLFCGKPLQGRKSKHYCNDNCRISAFRQKGR